MAEQTPVGIRVTAVDLESGQSSECTLVAGKRGQYVVITAEPMYLAHEQRHANGTVVLTLKHREADGG